MQELRRGRLRNKPGIEGSKLQQSARWRRTKPMGPFFGPKANRVDSLSVPRPLASAPSLRYTHTELISLSAVACESPLVCRSCAARKVEVRPTRRLLWLLLSLGVCDSASRRRGHHSIRRPVALAAEKQAHPSEPPMQLALFGV